MCVDATAPHGVPGRIHRIDLGVSDLPADDTFASSHSFGLAQAVALARILRLAPPRIIVYGIEGRSFDYGASLTPAVAAAVSDAAENIVAEVERLLSASDPTPRDPTSSRWRASSS